MVLRDVSVAYAGRTVLDRFSTTLLVGGRYALTGRSGSGKTTLLLLLAGLLVPESGTVDSGFPALDVIYVPQAPSLVPELTVAENASLGLRLRGVAPAQAVERGREQLHLLGLDDADDALPAQLSGGMQQRVALAGALAVRPHLLLADETTGTLDQVTGRLVLKALLSQAADRSTTLVVATHDPIVASHFTSQIRLDPGSGS